MAGKPDQGGIVLKRKELMMSLQLCICCRVQVVKIIPLIKIQEKIIGIPSKKIQKKIMLHARNVVLGMAIALKSEFAVTGVVCGSTKGYWYKEKSY